MIPMRNLLSSVLIVATLAGAASCSWFSGKGTVAENAAIDCAKADLGQTVADAGLSILMTVSSILFNGGSDWQADLKALEAKYGPEVIACAEHVAEELFRTAPSGSGSSAPSTSEQEETPHDRAVRVLSGKSFR